MVVTGEVDKNKLVRNNGALPGDVLILTKPLGTGIISTAIKKEKASEEQINAVVESMSALNKAAADAMNGLDIHAVTDVTGFGLLGHLREMCLASKVSAEINFRNLDFLKGVRELAEAGVVPGGTKRNLDFVKDAVIFDNKLSEVEQLLTADAQTSGGLLIAMPEKSVPDYINNMDPDYFYKPVQIGMITNKTVYLISVN